MDTSDLAEDKLNRFKRNPWTDLLFRPVVITIMIMCLAVSAVNLVRLVNPAWNGIYFLLGIFIVTVEAIYSYRLLKNYSSWRVSIVRYRLAELVILFLILKLLNFAGMSMAQINAELQASWQDPTNLFSSEFAIMLFLAVLAWLAATDTVDDFEALYNIHTGTSYALQLLRNRFFWGGLILVFISGLSHTILVYGFESLKDFFRPTLGGVLINVLVYFMLGLVLMSQINLTRLSVRWHLQDLSPEPGLIKNWGRVGLIFLGLITVIAFILPTHYTMGLLEVAGVLVGGLIQIVIGFYYLLFLLLNFILYLLYRLFGAAAENETPLPPLSPPPLLAESGPPPQSWPWLELLQSLFFWLLALGIVVYMVKVYLEDHPNILKQLKNIKLIRFILTELTQLWRLLTKWTRLTIDKLPRQIKLSIPQRENVTPGQFLDWVGFRRMDSRQRIMAYYLNILRRAEKAGTVRQPHETPYEYEPGLEQTVPEAHEEIKQLTEAFVKARYSRQPVDPAQVATIKVYWQRLKQALMLKR